MESIVALLVLIIVACVGYYITLRITKDTTFAFIVGVVIVLVGFFGKGFIG